MQIKDEEALTYLGKLKGDLNRRLRDKYCHFRRDHGHDIADYYDLKQQIETFIKQGKLQKFVRKERADLPPKEQHPRRDNERPRPSIGDIRMIVGGTVNTWSSPKSHKTYFRMVQNVQLTSSIPKIARRECPIIGFSEEDARRFHHPHNDALVVNIRVGDYNMHQVLVDNGSSTDILYYPTFQKWELTEDD